MGNPYSSLKIFHHKDALDSLERKEHRAPIYIRLKPTNFCNHHCILYLWIRRYLSEDGEPRQYRASRYDTVG